ncbi:MAG: hypothetical protein COB50_05380 [Thiotrichales bacterium]|nr:MAG: hypothetical protein COB50_05380 [Thiotrichales bacterium]
MVRSIEDIITEKKIIFYQQINKDELKLLEALSFTINSFIYENSDLIANTTLNFNDESNNLNFNNENNNLNINGENNNFNINGEDNNLNFNNENNNLNFNNENNNPNFNDENNNPNFNDENNNLNRGVISDVEKEFLIQIRKGGASLEEDFKQIRKMGRGVVSKHIRSLSKLLEILSLSSSQSKILDALTSLIGSCSNIIKSSKY